MQTRPTELRAALSARHDHTPAVLLDRPLALRTGLRIFPHGFQTGVLFIDAVFDPGLVGGAGFAFMPGAVAGDAGAGGAGVAGEDVGGDYWWWWW